MGLRGGTGCVYGVSNGLWPQASQICGLWSTVGARTRTATVSRALILSYPIYGGPRLCKGHLSLVEAGVVEGDDG